MKVDATWQKKTRNETALSPRGAVDLLVKTVSRLIRMRTVPIVERHPINR